MVHDAYVTVCNRTKYRLHMFFAALLQNFPGNYFVEQIWATASEWSEIK